MDRCELVDQIVKYSALYTGDSNSNDERNTYPFHAPIPEEQMLREKLATSKIILLTGEAGDGKSRLFKALGEYARALGFNHIVEDFSALSESEKAGKIALIERIHRNESRDKIMLGANIGLLVQSILRADRLTFEELRGSQELTLINFEQRNLAHSAEFFSEIITAFLSGTVPACANKMCRYFDDCPFEKNLRAILNERNVRENIRLLCNAVYLMGAHITLRELFSLIASMVTHGLDCRDLQQKKPPDDKMAYYNIFDQSDGVVLDKIHALDPANLLNPGDSMIYKECGNDLRRFISRKRERFFQAESNTYRSLPVPYLQDFDDLLRLLCAPPRAYDVTQSHSSIEALKQGLVKLISPEETDLEIHFFDVPLPVSRRIKTQFSIDFNEISLIVHHPNWKPADGGRPAFDGGFDSICSVSLSGFTDTDGREPPTLSIGFELFTQILLARDNYYFPSSGSGLHKYGLFDFFRQILSANPKCCEKVSIIFDDSSNCNFEMSYHTPRVNVLGTSGAKRVQIKRKN